MKPAEPAMLDAARSELYLCLARAFMTPREPTLADALRTVLADDLDELAAILGLDIAAPLASLREELVHLPDAAALLQIYSALFLVPPVAARLNVGWYLDGAVDGGSVRAMERAYRACGVERDEGFHDLSDHVGVQLEFVAWLWRARADAAVAPGRFLGDFASQWIGPLIADLERARAETRAANPYLPLARILEAAIAADALAPEVDERAQRHRRALDAARAKYARRGIDDATLAEIRDRLEQRGLSTDHLPRAIGLAFPGR